MLILSFNIAIYNHEWKATLKFGTAGFHPSRYQAFSQEILEIAEGR